jgi:peptidoglycan/xylan/chitin deacetylase (PgdA/CDA1 family)
VRPKDRLADLLYRSGGADVCRPRKDLLVVFGYHRIRHDGVSTSTRFDDGVFGPTAATFRAQLQWLLKRARLLSADELMEHVETGAPLKEPCAVVTFDDGYRDNYTIALPILEELGVPAIFFIPTLMIERRRLGWWDLIAYFLKRAPRTSIDFDGRLLPAGYRCDEAIDYLHGLMKTEPAGRTADLLERLSTACGVPFPSHAEQDAELMTWDQIRDAGARGMTIGSHTHSHRVLRTLDRAGIDDELGISKGVLEREIGWPVRTLAYPVGGYAHFDDRARESARRAGYRLAFSFNTGVQRLRDLEPFDVRRLSPGRELGRFAAIATFPRLFAWAA